MGSKIKCYITHFKIIRPIKSVLKKIHKEVRQEMITGVPMKLPTCYYLEYLRLTKPGRQLIKKYKDEYVVNANRFHAEGFAFNRAIDRILKSMFSNGAFLVEAIKDQIPPPKLEEPRIISDNEQLKELKAEITYEGHYLKTLKRLPKAHFIHIAYYIGG